MQYWLIKTEPEEWSWKQQVKSANEGAEWSGVRNFQASKNLRNMKIGDKCFFYHTGKTKSIMGIVEVKKEAFLDKSDKTRKFVSVAVKALYPLKKEVFEKDFYREPYKNKKVLWTEKNPFKSVHIEGRQIKGVNNMIPMVVFMNGILIVSILLETS